MFPGAALAVILWVVFCCFFFSGRHVHQDTASLIMPLTVFLRIDLNSWGHAGDILSAVHDAETFRSCALTVLGQNRDVLVILQPRSTNAIVSLLHVGVCCDSPSLLACDVLLHHRESPSALFSTGFEPFRVTKGFEPFRETFRVSHL